MEELEKELLELKEMLTPTAIQDLTDDEITALKELIKKITMLIENEVNQDEEFQNFKGLDENEE